MSDESEGGGGMPPAEQTVRTKIGPHEAAALSLARHEQFWLDGYARLAQERDEARADRTVVVVNSDRDLWVARFVLRDEPPLMPDEDDMITTVDLSVERHPVLALRVGLSGVEAMHSALGFDHDSDDSSWRCTLYRHGGVDRYLVHLGPEGMVDEDGARKHALVRLLDRRRHQRSVLKAQNMTDEEWRACVAEAFTDEVKPFFPGGIIKPNGERRS